MTLVADAARGCGARASHRSAYLLNLSSHLPITRLVLKRHTAASGIVLVALRYAVRAVHGMSCLRYG
jgi:PII-like signaling protein